ncbi:hypothetical protein RY831_15215 [Noviherbaspirillum sp. CPCC 100848]|uniref:Uncharacterized protein n=1 Tax=Noviherbaspirillum album TaxID=3080276 RepID=A0ABU6JA33_9BURK|nr:hypothetical protein [Noviherbaspirillum sp. CPCC 100848]MEC4720511.1 hypothetical protein [Noviherbaspirillum sp. CPCC 100848]
MTGSMRQYEEIGGYKYWIDAVALPRYSDYGPTRYRGRIHIVQLPNTERMMDEPVIILNPHDEKTKVDAIGLAESELRYYLRYDLMQTMIHFARERALLDPVSFD